MPKLPTSRIARTARLAREYIAGDPPSTPLGEQDAAFWGKRTLTAPR